MFQDLKVAFFLGLKSIVRGNKATIVLMVFILSLAFVNLIFTSSILDGILESINKQILTNVVSNIVIDPQEEPTRKEFITHAFELGEQIKNIPGVVAVVRRYNLGATFAYDKERNGKYKYLSGEITGVDPKEEKNISEIESKIIDGQYLDELDTDNIVIGASLAGGYEGSHEIVSLGGVKVGDTVKVSFSNGIKRDYKIKGVFLTKFDEVDRMAFVSFRESESLLSIYNSATQMLVKISERGRESEYVEKIQALAPNLKVRKWTEYMGPMEGISKSFDIINLIISVIGLAVAAITIFILIYVNVVNKRRQIGILKAIGIKSRIITFSYVFQAFFYAFFGVLMGLILIFFVVAPYFITHPLDMPIGDVSLLLEVNGIIFSALSLLAASLVAGFVPSWQAARENILRAIWGA